MRRRAFSLIELLVVVGIVAILVSVLLPALGRARGQARRAVCAAHLQQLGTALYEYWTEWNGRVPYVESPMTNGRGRPPRSATSVPGFGSDAWSDADLDPFDRALWPMSLPNVLMPAYLGEAAGVFVCPAARIGWPRAGGALRYTYRPAAANQPYGVVLDPEEYWYFREHFAFLDGRMLRKLRLELTGSPAADAQRLVTLRGTYVRDLIVWDGDRVFGPHGGGIMVLNRDLQVEFRDQATTQEDLAPHFTGAKF